MTDPNQPMPQLTGAEHLKFDISYETVRDLILEVMPSAQWPELVDLFSTNKGPVNEMNWLQPGMGCTAVGGHYADVLPAMAAMACAHLSINLIDDMLDEEADGRYHQFGIGRTANLAAALQAAGTILVEQCPVPHAHRHAAILSFNKMILGTAAGQELDVSNLTGEENYWRVLQAKSTPFFGAGIEIGALLAGAPADVAGDLYKVGALLGEAIQILDDLEDAFKVPANADWLQGRNNLAILYGLTADYPQKTSFIQLMNRIENDAILKQAQQLLIECGAVSYCAYQLMTRHGAIQQLLKALPLTRVDILDNPIRLQLDPFLDILARLDAQLPAQFLAALKSTKEDP